MAKRRKKDPTFLELAFQLIVGCSFFLAFNIMVGNYGVTIGGAWLNPLLIVTIVILSISMALRIIYVHEKLKKANINEIDKMSGSMFERYLEQFFKRQGWQVKRTGGKGDYGADLILSSSSKKVVIQAKRWKKNVGYEAIQQAHTSKDIYGCDEAWVITNSGFTEQARDGAKRLGIVLWDREVLIEQMASINASETINVPNDNIVPITVKIENNSISSIDNNSIVCHVCGKSVTSKVKDYCLSNSQRFNGKIYCYEHQKNNKYSR